MIDHHNGYFTRYGHLKSVGVTETQSIVAGTPLGIIGNTGNSTGTHLHFMVYRDTNGSRIWDKNIDKPVDVFARGKVDHLRPIAR